MKMLLMLIGLVAGLLFGLMSPIARIERVAASVNQPMVLRDLSPPLHNEVAQAILTAENQPTFAVPPIRSNEGSKIAVSRGFIRVGVVRRE